jgi:heme exporter protein D
MMESVLAFLRQGGYAFFVWGAFSVTFLLLIAETVQLRTSRRTILSRVGRLVRLRGSNRLRESNGAAVASEQTAPPQRASTPQSPAKS